MWFILEYGVHKHYPVGVTWFNDEDVAREVAKKHRVDLPEHYTVYLVGPVEQDTDVLHLDNPNLIHRIENCGAV
jgi:hypothetical protein